MVVESTSGEVGRNISDFNLLGVDNKWYTVKDALGTNGLLVMFICNHCPYVKSIISNLAEDLSILKDEFKINSVAIMPNDYVHYPEDSFENMQEFSKIHKFSFPYLLDETQEVAKMYGAVCTPDFFVYDRNLTERYHGRFDASGKQKLNNKREDRELFIAMKEIALSGSYSGTQIHSIGCSIKWKI